MGRRTPFIKPFRAWGVGVAAMFGGVTAVDGGVTARLVGILTTKFSDSM
jgi:hypothetical protein